MSEPQPSDEALVAVFKESGRVETLNTLTLRHLGGVRAMVHQMILNDADADDVTQKVFVRAIRGIAGFRGQSQFSTWLYQIAMNTVRGFLRARERVQAAHKEDLAERADGRAFTPEQFAMARELDGELTVAMHGLPANLRAAIVLASFNGVDACGAAKIEGCSTATMYWRIHKARKILKKRLAKYLI